VSTEVCSFGASLGEEGQTAYQSDSGPGKQDNGDSSSGWKRIRVSDVQPLDRSPPGRHRGFPKWTYERRPA